MQEGGFFFDIMEDPLYLNWALDITGLKGSFKKDLKDPIIYYEISSECGLYPRKMKKFYKNVAGFSFGNKVYKSLEKLIFKRTVIALLFVQRSILY